MSKPTPASQANTPSAVLQALKNRTMPAPNVTAAISIATPISSAAVKTFHVFYNTMKSCKMITFSGRIISFVDGKFITDVQEDIDYLKLEMAMNNPYLYTKVGEEVQTSDELDPMKALRARHFEEFQREQAALAARIAAGQNLAGGTEPQNLTPGSTADLNGLADGSNSVGQ